jgi:hypothetical protein
MGLDGSCYRPFLTCSPVSSIYELRIQVPSQEMDIGCPVLERRYIILD